MLICRMLREKASYLREQYAKNSDKDQTKAYEASGNTNCPDRLNNEPIRCSQSG